MKKKTEFVVVSDDYLDIRLAYYDSETFDDGRARIIISQGSDDYAVVFGAKDVKAFSEALLELCDANSPDTSLGEP